MFRQYLLTECNVSLNDWGAYRSYMLGFRNEYVALRKIEEYDKAVPVLNLAYETAIILERWIRIKIAPDFIDAKPFYELVNEYSSVIRETLKQVEK